MKNKGRGVLSVLLFLASTLALAGSYAPSEIVAEVKNLARKMDLAPDKTAELVQKVETALQSTELKEEIQNKPVNAVMVYSSAEGGLVVKIMKGQGLVSFKDGRKNAPIYLKSVSAGAMIGGGAQWAAGLILGLKNEGELGGDYKGVKKSAAAVDATTSGGIFLMGAKDHKIFLVTTVRGFSADAGKTKLTITRGW
ncbi:MAG: hypothetical protein A2Y86_09225 [Candidatus Aminicenantes bacterium RBG_13_62_12]|nr:MAG: hypothetical protein A2Y86_09225 [Candidatus Aminicenantes bacterium RBG_13_62_12]